MNHDTEQYWTTRFQQELRDPKLYCVWNGKRERYEVKRTIYRSPHPFTDHLILTVQDAKGGYRTPSEDTIRHLKRIDSHRRELNLREMDYENNIQLWKSQPLGKFPTY